MHLPSCISSLSSPVVPTLSSSSFNRDISHHPSLSHDYSHTDELKEDPPVPDSTMIHDSIVDVLPSLLVMPPIVPEDTHHMDPKDTLLPRSQDADKRASFHLDQFEVNKEELSTTTNSTNGESLSDGCCSIKSCYSTAGGNIVSSVVTSPIKLSSMPHNDSRDEQSVIPSRYITSSSSSSLGHSRSSTHGVVQVLEWSDHNTLMEMDLKNDAVHHDTDINSMSTPTEDIICHNESFKQLPINVDNTILSLSVKTPENIVIEAHSESSLMNGVVSSNIVKDNSNNDLYPDNYHVNNHHVSDICGLTLLQLRKRLSILSKEQLLELAAFGMHKDKEMFDVGDALLECDPASRRIMVRGLWFCTSDATFRYYFSKFGELENSAVIRHPDGRSQGYGFLIYKDRLSAQNVVNQRHILDDRTVTAKLAADQYTEFARDEEGQSVSLERRKLFIRNICSDITRDILEHEFSMYGLIEECAIIRTAVGAAKGYGFVTFKNPADALKAAQIPFRVIRGWVVFVTFSTGKSRSSSTIHPTNHMQHHSQNPLHHNSNHHHQPSISFKHSNRQQQQYGDHEIESHIQSSYTNNDGWNTSRSSIILPDHYNNYIPHNSNIMTYPTGGANSFSSSIGGTNQGNGNQVLLNDGHSSINGTTRLVSSPISSYASSLSSVGINQSSNHVYHHPTQQFNIGTQQYRGGKFPSELSIQKRMTHYAGMEYPMYEHHSSIFSTTHFPQNQGRSSVSSLFPNHLITNKSSLSSNNQQTHENHKDVYKQHSNTYSPTDNDHLLENQCCTVESQHTPAGSIILTDCEQQQQQQQQCIVSNDQRRQTDLPELIESNRRQQHSISTIGTTSQYNNNNNTSPVSPLHVNWSNPPSNVATSNSDNISKQLDESTLYGAASILPSDTMQRRQQHQGHPQEYLCSTDTQTLYQPMIPPPISSLKSAIRQLNPNGTRRRATMGTKEFHGFNHDVFNEYEENTTFTKDDQGYHPEEYHHLSSPPPPPPPLSTFQSTSNNDSSLSHPYNEQVQSEFMNSDTIRRFSLPMSKIQQQQQQHSLNELDELTDVNYHHYDSVLTNGTDNIYTDTQKYHHNGMTTRTSERSNTLDSQYSYFGLTEDINPTDLSLQRQHMSLRFTTTPDTGGHNSLDIHDMCQLQETLPSLDFLAHLLKDSTTMFSTDTHSLSVEQTESQHN